MLWKNTKILEILFNLLLIVGLNNRAPKKFQHHISVFGMYITDNNADHHHFLAAEFFLSG